MTRYC